MIVSPCAHTTTAGNWHSGKMPRIEGMFLTEVPVTVIILAVTSEGKIGSPDTAVNNAPTLL